MTDPNQQQDPNQVQDHPQQDSYVDAYNPPSVQPQQSASSDDQSGDGQSDNSSDSPADDMAASMGMTSAPSTNSVSQALEDQNIFFLLGVTDGTEEERESFLDELQQVIWDDFLENDVELLITEEELTELEKITGATGKSEEEMQEEIIVYLEKLIPDLEEIMLEKALELKEDMVRERVLGMREYYTDDQASLDKINQADDLLDDDQWRAAAELLNSLAA